jgi:hypothetical protein
MADGRDPILDGYDPVLEEHINGIIRSDIPYVPPVDEEDDVSSYLTLDDEGQCQGQGMDIEAFVGGQTNNDPELQTNTFGDVYIYIEPLVIQI